MDRFKYIEISFEDRHQIEGYLERQVAKGWKVVYLSDHILEPSYQVLFPYCWHIMFQGTDDLEALNKS
jgi:hypothetical protein